MRRDSFAAGFWCALVVVALIMVVDLRRPETPREVIHDPAPPMAAARFVSPTVEQSRTFVVPERDPGPPRLLVEPRASFSGNRNTHRFHRLSCRYATCANCTASFATREEAIADGFRPGGCCNP